MARIPPVVLTVAVGAALFAPAVFLAAALPEAPGPATPRPAAGAPAVPPPPAAGPPAAVPRGAPGGEPVGAADLLAATARCDVISQGRYPRDAGGPEEVPVCGDESAVYWRADLDIDCDGRAGPHCNADTDPMFTGRTALTQSDGRYLSAEELPYVVVPEADELWDPQADGVRVGCVAALVHGGRVVYAVVGDSGPGHVIGEASYAAAAALDVPTDPTGGGADDVTYIVFRDSRVVPPENPWTAAAEGERRAAEFVRRRLG